VVERLLDLLVLHPHHRHRADRADRLLDRREQEVVLDPGVAAQDVVDEADDRARLVERARTPERLLRAREDLVDDAVLAEERVGDLHGAPPSSPQVAPSASRLRSSTKSTSRAPPRSNARKPTFASPSMLSASHARACSLLR